VPPRWGLGCCAASLAAAYNAGVATVSNDYLTLLRRTQVRGSVYASTALLAKGFADTIQTAAVSGAASVLRDEPTQDTEWNGSTATVKTLKLDFELEAVDRIVGLTGLLECRVSESVKYSGTRWVAQPIPRAADSTGGVSIVQDGGLTEGGRTVRGSVTATGLATAQAWAIQQRMFLGVDADGNGYRLPEEMETDYEFVPRTDGVATVVGGDGEINVRLWRVSFTFGEILANYPALA